MSLKKIILKQAKKALDAKSAYLLTYPDRTRIVTEFNVPFIYKQYNTKLLNSISNPPQKYKKDPLLPPFDDNIYVTSTDTNYILINKFMQVPGHIVLSSKDPNEEQGNPLNRGDFIDMEKILSSFEYGIAYYNSGLKSGCSQLHKHTQFTPLEKTPLFDAMKKKMKLPFVYRVEHFNNKIDANSIESAYKQLVKNLPSDCFNFIVDKKCACVIPRIKEMDRNGIVVNSIVMSGTITTWPEIDPSVYKHPMKTVLDGCIRI